MPSSGVIGHVVISAGEGRTVEVHSTKRGVIEGRVDGRRWTTGVAVPGMHVTVENPRPARRPGLVLRVKTPFMKGEIVKEVQRRLRKAKVHAGPIDGAYGPQAAAAVQAFQTARGAVTGGLRGLGLAILAGGVIGFLAERGRCDDCGTAVLVVGAAGGVLGVSGTILGAKYVDTRWRRVSYPVRDPAP